MIDNRHCVIAQAIAMLTDVRATTRAVAMRKLEASGAVDGLGCTAGEAALWLDNLPLICPASPVQLTYAPSSGSAQAAVRAPLRPCLSIPVEAADAVCLRHICTLLSHDVSLRPTLLLLQLRVSGSDLPSRSSRCHGEAALRGPGAGDTAGLAALPVLLAWLCYRCAMSWQSKAHASAIAVSDTCL